MSTTKSTRFRVLRWVLGIVAGIALLLVLLVGAVLYSEPVFERVATWATPLVPGELQYQDIGGSPGGRLAFTEVDYRIGGTVIHAKLLAFKVKPFALFRGDIRLQEVHATDLAVQLPPPSDTTDNEPFRPRKLVQALKLPVHIHADAIAVDGFTLRDAGSNPLFALDRFRAALDWNDERAQVTQLEAQGPLLDAKGRLLLGLAEGEQSDIALNVAWHDLAFPLQGRINAAGVPEHLELHATLDAPGDVRLEAVVENLLDTPHWRGTLAVESIVPARLQPGLPDSPLSGTFRFDGNWNDTSIRGSASGAWPPADEIQLQFDANTNTERVLVHQLEAFTGAFGATVNATGRVSWSGALQYETTGTVNSFSWPGVEQLTLHDIAFDLAGDATQVQGKISSGARGTAQGRVELKGTLAYDNLAFDVRAAADRFVLKTAETPLQFTGLELAGQGTVDDWKATLATRLKAADLPAAALAMQANGDSEQLQADVTRLAWLDGDARGHVEISWRDALAAGLTLQGQGFELARLDPQLTATVGGAITGSVDLSGETPAAMLRIESLRGDVAGTRLEGSGSLRLQDNRLSTRGLQVSAGDARLALEDAVDSGFDFSLDVPSLAQLHTGLSGNVSADGHFQGTLARPEVRLHATGTRTRWQDWSLGGFDLDVRLQELGVQDSSVRLSATQVRTPFIDSQLLALDATGTRDTHVLKLDASGAGKDGTGNMELALHGGLQGNEWQGAIDRLAFAHPSTGKWRLAESAGAIELGGDTIKVPRHCLQGPEGRACVGPLAGNANNWSANASLKALPVGVIAGWLPAGLDYAGRIDGELDVKANSAGYDGSAQFRLSEGGIRQTSGDGDETLLGWEEGVVGVTFNGRDATGKLNVSLNDGGRITGKGTLKVPEQGKPQIDAHLAAMIDNLQLVPSLVPELSSLQGRITADLDVTGDLDDPRIVGHARLHNANARILALGTRWENINATLKAEGRAITGEASAHAGDGTLHATLQGRDTGKGFAGKATITGENFKAVETPEANVDISPKLHVELKERDLYLDGEVRVPFARIQPRDLSSAQQPSSDQVIVNAKPEDTEGIRVHAAVTTVLGDDVRVNAFGLSARVAGKLTVAQEPKSAPIGTGRLSIIEGKYKAYGQDLTLARGEIIYTGQPLSNPGLDIRAERKIDPDVVAGVSVRGPLSQPTANVYSDPPMPDTEALSYLLFGRPLAQATGQQESDVSNAALAFNLGGQKLLGNVGRRLGVEEVRVDQVGDPDRASLVLGKYLSPDLYVSYGIGLFEAVNTFRVRYHISSKWTLEATSGLTSSADVMYTIER